MPKGLTSCARLSWSASTAHFEAQQKPMSGTATIPIPQETPSMWPATLLPEEGQRSLIDQKRGEEVRLEQSPNVCLARFPNCANQGVASILKDNIQPAEVHVSLPDDIPYLFGSARSSARGGQRRRSVASGRQRRLICRR